MKLNTDQINAVDLLYKTYGRTEITRSEINDLVKKGKLKNIKKNNNIIKDEDSDSIDSALDIINNE